jgi:hypothetical protein
VGLREALDRAVLTARLPCGVHTDTVEVGDSDYEPDAVSVLWHPPTRRRKQHRVHMRARLAAITARRAELALHQDQPFRDRPAPSSPQDRTSWRSHSASGGHPSGFVIASEADYHVLATA